MEDAKDILQLEELSHDEMMLLHENYSRKYPDNRIRYPGYPVRHSLSIKPTYVTYGMSTDSKETQSLN